VATLVACGAHDPAPASSVAALGDSITEGMSAAYGYPELLPIWRDVPVHNLGVRGQTTAQMLARVPAVVATGPLPQVVIVLGGTNDVGRDWPTETSMRHLHLIVQGLRGAGREPVLVCPPPAGKLPLEPLRALGQAVRAYSREHGLRVVDPWPVLEDRERPGWLRPELTRDQLHPNERGQFLLAREIARTLGWVEP
jgi:acyl-CoA thioesterase I